MRRRLWFLLAVMALLPTGCTLAPKFVQPEAPIPAEWPTGAAYTQASAAIGAPAATELKWQAFFTDDQLQKVVAIALENNGDLRLAVLNVQRAQALYAVQRAELLPSVNAVGGGSKQRVPADLSTTGEVVTPQQYSINLGLTAWEIDFFGRIRSLKDRALEEYLATEQARRSVQISLVSAVAEAHLSLAADQEALKLAQATLDSQRAAYDLIKKRCDVGIATELDLSRAQTQVDTARGDVALYTQWVAQDENALNLLAGSTVPQELLPTGLDSVEPSQAISAGITSEVLLHRPDILATEHLLRAANANIGAARAALFPRISLTTGIGTASEELSGLFKSGSDTWNFAPQVSLPIFDARAWSALKVTEADREIAVAQYEKAIQTAFREVADALAVRGTIGERLSAQQSLAEATAQTYRLSDVRYLKGIDSYLGVLDAQRSLYAAQQGLVTLRLDLLTSQVQLYRVLGGGGN